MSNCEIEVRLDRDEPHYEPGESVTGVVEVEVDGECDNDGIAIALAWYTHGRGNLDAVERHRETVSTETWQPGETYTYDFSFETPPGPATYRGTYVNVDWRVEASADIPWAFDPEGRADLVVEPAASEEYVPGEASTHRERLERSEGGAAPSPLRFLGGGVMFLGGAIPMITVLANPVGISTTAIMAIMTLPFLGIGAWLIYGSVRNYFAEMRLGDVALEIDPGEVRPGGSTRARVAFSPESEVELTEVRFMLKGRERAVSGSGTNKTTYTQLLHEEVEVPAESEGAGVAAGEQVEYTASFEVPASAPYTFHADDNHVEWQIECHVDIPGWPDWLHTFPLLVCPSAEADTAGRHTEAEARASDPDEYAVEW